MNQSMRLFRKAEKEKPNRDAVRAVRVQVRVEAMMYFAKGFHAQNEQGDGFEKGGVQYVF
jgi:hypothetical protein